MKRQHLRSIFEYDGWASGRLLESARGLSIEQLTRPMGSSFASVRDTLGHIVDAQWIWLERFRGNSPSVPPGLTYHDVESLARRYAEIGGGLGAFVKAISEDELDAPFSYRTMAGAPQSSLRWQALLHLANHGTYHRGQVTGMLRQLGVQPPATDLIVYYRKRDGFIPDGPMPAEVIRQIFEFNAWANHRMLDAAASLAQEAFLRDLKSSFRSLRDTLAHIEWVEWLYRERWHGRSPGPMPSVDRFRSVEILRAEWSQMERLLLDDVGGFAAADLARPQAFRTTSGESFEQPLWQLLRHVVNHSTYHRGQVAMLLRQLGTKAQATDLIAYFREQAARASS